MMEYNSRSEVHGKRSKRWNVLGSFLIAGSWGLGIVLVLAILKVVTDWYSNTDLHKWVTLWLGI